VTTLADVATSDPEGQMPDQLLGVFRIAASPSRPTSCHCFAEVFGYRVVKKLSTTADTHIT